MAVLAEGSVFLLRRLEEVGGKISPPTPAAAGGMKRIHRDGLT
jgi:hypothetical protein